jgi:hypothetical protein
MFAALSILPARAAPAGCEIIATGNGNTSCRYTAAGVGTYEVQSWSGFRIQVSTDGGLHWLTLVARTAPPNTLTGGVSYESGALATTAGQLVDVAIQVATWTPPPTSPPLPPSPGTIRYQDGRIKAGDAAA